MISKSCACSTLRAPLLLLHSAFNLSLDALHAPCAEFRLGERWGSVSTIGNDPHHHSLLIPIPMIVLCKQLQVIVTTDVVPGIVPEFDIPGHSKGFEPLAWGPNPDIMFCSELPDVNQLYDDPAVRYVPSAPVLFASRIGNFARSHSNILVV
jgi:hypothetical protein